jgi:S-adenosylmethionine:tRNA ribosyltransferase-isomerase
MNRSDGGLDHRHFHDLSRYLDKGDMLIVNNARVLPARFQGQREGSGGKAEILLHRPMPDGSWLALIRPSKRMKPGSFFVGAGGLRIRIAEEVEESRRVFLESPESWEEAMSLAGEIPLPPYIERSADERDRKDYQTLFASEPGAVAAPTAGLHFSEALLEKLRDQGVRRGELSLFVGPGTFLPVRSENLEEHPMHREAFQLRAELRREMEEVRAAGKRVLAVGTTVVRALESLSEEEWNSSEDLSSDTQLFIRPPFQFRRVDGMITNFHLPRSTLLMLVSAFCGREALLLAYREAVDRGYRFYSYGDAMLISDGGSK